MKTLFDIQDRVIVLTGGLGRLGTEFSAFLADQGAKVAIVDTPERARTSSTGSANRRLFPADITEKVELERSLRDIERAWGTPGALVHCAAIDAPPDADSRVNGPFEQLPQESWDAVLAVNTTGVFLSSQVFGSAMAGAGRGSIVLISSIYGEVSPDQRLYEYRRAAGEPFFKPAAYGSSKAAAANLMRYLATYWSGRGVRANTLTLGGVFSGQDPRFVEAYCRRVPLGRMAKADDYLGALLYLVSDASCYMTGANMVVDGGWTAW